MEENLLQPESPTVPLVRIENIVVSGTNWLLTPLVEAALIVFLFHYIFHFFNLSLGFFQLHCTNEGEGVRNVHLRYVLIVSFTETYVVFKINVNIHFNLLDFSQELYYSIFKQIYLNKLIT